MSRSNSSLVLFPFMALGIRLGSQGLFDPGILLIVAAAAALIWLISAYRGSAKAWFFRLVLGLAAVALGQLAILPQEVWVVPREGEFIGQVYQVQKLTYDQRVLVHLKPSRLQVAVHLPLDVSISPGNELTFWGTIAQPNQAPNPGAFCYRDYLRRLGVFGVCYPTEFQVTAGDNPGLLARARGVMRRNIVTHIRDPGLVLALVLGERDELGEGRRDSWRLLGISHLLAISGMHVGYVALGVSLVVKRFPCRPLFKLALLQGLLLSYIVISGTGASGWRAFLVSLLGGYAGLRGLRRDPLHIWATAGLIMLLVKPALAFDLSFALSFAASGGILLWSPTMQVRWKSRTLTYLAQSLLLSLTAQCSLVPFLMGSFGEVALLGPLATLLFLPCAAVLIVGGLLTALGLGSLGIGSVLNRVMQVVQAMEALLLPYARQWKLGTLNLWEISLWWALFIYAGWRLRQPRLTKPWRTLAQLCSLFVIVLFISTLPPVVRRPLEITALNVGQGDSFYVRTPSGLHLLIDGGGDLYPWQPRTRDAGVERVVPYLRHRQVERLDYVILSHPHDDHLGGLLAVLEEFEVGMVLDNGHDHPSPTYERYLELLEEKEIPYHPVRAGDRVDLGDGITLTVLYPQALRPNLRSAQNNNSLLLRLQYGGVRMLFTGDLESAVLYDLAHDPNLDVQSQWLKIPHHGSRGSMEPHFYAAVDPAWAVIPVGPNNFGHPHEEVVEELNKRGIVWRTTYEEAQTFQVWWGVWGRFTRGPS
ncbi:DNA internalization-related competence protein ComEC/Rec2 [Candidatus Darwinibacter acetoxidans]